MLANSTVRSCSHEIVIAVSKAKIRAALQEHSVSLSWGGQKGQAESMACKTMLHCDIAHSKMVLSHEALICQLFSPFNQKLHPTSTLHWCDKAFPVQPHESGIPWFIQLFFVRVQNQLQLKRCHKGASEAPFPCPQKRPLCGTLLVPL